jgi:hypothetical protein
LASGGAQRIDAPCLPSSTPVNRQLGTLFENGQVFLAPVFLEILQGGAGLGDGAGFFEADTLGGLAAVDLVNHDQPGVKMAVALPQTANSALAVIEDFLVVCTAHDDGFQS